MGTLALLTERANAYVKRAEATLPTFTSATGTLSRRLSWGESEQLFPGGFVPGHALGLNLHSAEPADVLGIGHDFYYCNPMVRKVMYKITES